MLSWCHCGPVGVKLLSHCDFVLWCLWYNARLQHGCVGLLSTQEQLSFLKAASYCPAWAVGTWHVAVFGSTCNHTCGIVCGACVCGGMEMVQVSTTTLAREQSFQANRWARNTLIGMWAVHTQRRWPTKSHIWKQIDCYNFIHGGC